MAKTLLIYDDLTPLDADKHHDLYIDHIGDFSFAKHINASQILATEFSQAAVEYPIIFAGEKGNMFPSVLLGITTDENLFIDQNGSWMGDYIPAFLRRYPFLFSINEDRSQFTLCFDAGFAGFNTAQKGTTLFNDDRSHSDYLKHAINFTQSYHAEFEKTKTLTQDLEDLGLFEPARANMNLDGTRTALAGFKTISREKLSKLPASKIKSLVKSGHMELIYTHLYSLRNVDRMAKLYAQTKG